MCLVHSILYSKGFVYFFPSSSRLCPMADKAVFVISWLCYVLSLYKCLPRLSVVYDRGLHPCCTRYDPSMIAKYVCNSIMIYNPSLRKIVTDSHLVPVSAPTCPVRHFQNVLREPFCYCDMDRCRQQDVHSEYPSLVACKYLHVFTIVCSLLLGM
jgi:hypothetical protein